MSKDCRPLVPEAARRDVQRSLWVTMHERGPSIVDGQPGFAPQVGRLVAMLAYARRTTLKAVEGLTAAQLDHLHDPLSNSIGALLAHAAAIAVACQCTTFERVRTRERR